MDSYACNIKSSQFVRFTFHIIKEKQIPLGTTVYYVKSKYKMYEIMKILSELVIIPQT